MYNVVRTTPGFQRDSHTVLSRWQTREDAETALVELAQDLVADTEVHPYVHSDPVFVVHGETLYRINKS